MRLTARNWSEFQHYKDRSPPWIRLHRKLLDNKDFQRLPVESRALAPMLWLLASESVDGVINATVDDLAFRLRCTEAEIEIALRPLVDRGFFLQEQDASDVLAGRQQVAVPEAEAEREADAEASQTFGKAAAAAKPAKVKREKPETNSGIAWAAYSTAYHDRYSVDPVRNAPVNSQMAQFIGRIGAAEAPLIAAWYVGLDDRFYITAGHSVAVLLRDCEALRTRWATNRQTLQVVTQPTFRERDAEAAAERVAEMTGGILDNRKGTKPATMEIFDATPRLVG